MGEFLFAYGTLQPGRVPRKIAALVAKLRPVGEGFIRGVLYDLGRYPGAVPDARSKSTISGTVMALPEDESALRQLDEYEGFDPKTSAISEFVRELQVAELADGRSLECWLYRYNLPASPAQIIATGVWRAKERERPSRRKAATES